MVYTLEGVPSRNRSVPPLSSTRLYDPIASGFGYSFDFEEFYGSTGLLRAVNVLTGKSFLFADVNTVRSMGQDNKNSDGEQESFLTGVGFDKNGWPILITSLLILNGHLIMLLEISKVIFNHY